MDRAFAVLEDYDAEPFLTHQSYRLIRDPEKAAAFMAHAVMMGAAEDATYHPDPAGERTPDVRCVVLDLREPDNLGRRGELHVVAWEQKLRSGDKRVVVDSVAFRRLWEYAKEQSYRGNSGE